ncbi:hypothetical protein QQZ08_006524 [Neonectria magnoliae]|uniref:Uncharacterized protein n=1 Tax=Neonectria magnoliae TaxID=2732573 RepID=A0ABR1I1W8_9HYPO
MPMNSPQPQSNEGETSAKTLRQPCNTQRTVSAPGWVKTMLPSHRPERGGTTRERGFWEQLDPRNLGDARQPRRDVPGSHRKERSETIDSSRLVEWNVAKDVSDTEPRRDASQLRPRAASAAIPPSHTSAVGRKWRRAPRDDAEDWQMITTSVEQPIREDRKRGAPGGASRTAVPGSNASLSVKQRIPYARLSLEAKREARKQRRSLKESGDYLGVQGFNPQTGLPDVITPSDSEQSAVSQETDHSPNFLALFSKNSGSKTAKSRVEREIRKLFLKKEAEKIRRREQAKAALQKDNGSFSSVRPEQRIPSEPLSPTEFVANRSKLQPRGKEKGRVSFSGERRSVQKLRAQFDNDPSETPHTDPPRVSNPIFPARKPVTSGRETPIVKRGSVQETRRASSNIPTSEVQRLLSENEEMKDRDRIYSLRWNRPEEGLRLDLDDIPLTEEEIQDDLKRVRRKLASVDQPTLTTVKNVSQSEEGETWAQGTIRDITSKCDEFMDKSACTPITTTTGYDLQTSASSRSPGQMTSTGHRRRRQLSRVVYNLPDGDSMADSTWSSRTNPTPNTSLNSEPPVEIPATDIMSVRHLVPTKQRTESLVSKGLVAPETGAHPQCSTSRTSMFMVRQGSPAKNVEERNFAEDAKMRATGLASHRRRVPNSKLGKTKERRGLWSDTRTWTTDLAVHIPGSYPDHLAADDDIGGRSSDQRHEGTGGNRIGGLWGATKEVSFAAKEVVGKECSARDDMVGLRLRGVGGAGINCDVDMDFVGDEADSDGGDVG